MTENKGTLSLNAPALLLRVLLFGAALLVLILGMRAAQNLLAPLFLDGVLALLFTPLLRWLERRGLPGPLALFVLTLLVVAFLLLVILVIVVSLTQLEGRLPLYEELLLQRVNALATLLAGLGLNMQDSLKQEILNEATLVKTAIATVKGVLSNAIGVFFYLFLLFLLLASSRGLARKIQASQAGSNRFAQSFAIYARQIQTQYRIQALSNLLSAIGITIILLLFKVDFAFLWGFLAFILAFIPDIGLVLAVLPAVLIALLLYGPLTALLMVAIVVLVNVTMDNLVTPRFMGAGLNLSMLAIFLSFLIWSWILGFLGALLAVPATLLLRTLLRSREETRHLALFLEKTTVGGEH